MEVSDIKLITCLHDNYHGVELFNQSNLNEFIAISREGGLKLLFKIPVYIHKKHFDTYEVVIVRQNPVMVFTKDFDLDKAFVNFRDFRISQIEEIIKKWEIEKNNYATGIFNNKICNRKIIFQNIKPIRK
ncbi:MAG: hypothetical protein ABIN48_07180 [Ginsengibacter sp.]